MNRERLCIKNWKGNKMRRLILLSNSFPYDTNEAYLESEVLYYDSFDRTDIFALSVQKGKKMRKMPNYNIHITPVFFKGKLYYLLRCIFLLGNKDFYKEIKKLKNNNALSLNRVKRLIVFLVRAEYETKYIVKNLIKDKNIKKDKVILYSYRFEYQAYIAMKIKKMFPYMTCVARAHRYDLYEELNSEKYIPFREEILETLDKIILISEDGKKYLEKKYPKYISKYMISKLGTQDFGLGKQKRKHVFRIATCSYIVPVKQLDKLIDSLKLLSYEIEWVHFGNGVLYQEIKEKALKELPKNIHACFMGFVENKKVLDFYQKHIVNLFINVSSSEGIPVSVMEAISFGIPCIVTNVGGNGEIIHDKKNGYLLEKDFQAQDLAKLIKKIIEMSEEEYRELCDNARMFWEKEYSADKNYKKFVSELIEMNQ